MKRFIAYIIISAIALLAPRAYADEAVGEPSADQPVGMPSHFTWGADIGGSIDLSSNNNSSVDIDACFGYRNAYIKMLGVGASVNMMVSNSNRSIPIYAQLRTNFRKTPSLVFFDCRCGMSINYLELSETQFGFYGSAGIGFNLASGRSFASHIILSYSYLDRGYFMRDEVVYPNTDLHEATIRLGISF